MQKHKAIVMFSGGLDSTIAVHLLKSQGLDVTALHFLLPFYSGIDRYPTKIAEYADALGVPLRVEEEGEEYVEMIRSPSFGFGKNANPCVDCRIHRLKKAARIVDEEGAVCLATGEVAGQRPMSQKLPTLMKVEKLSGLTGRLLRPLSAKLLPPTAVEEAGIVDREKLLAISGRSRAVQLAYAKEHGLAHSAPAGGCLLTNVETGARFADLAENNPAFSLVDFKLLAYGRHFRRSPNYRLIVSRDGDENEVVEKICGVSVGAGGTGGMVGIGAAGGMGITVGATSPRNIIQFYLRDTTGPLAVGLGEPDEIDLHFSAAAVVRFSRLRNAGGAAVVARGDANGEQIDRVIETTAADDDELAGYRVCSGRRRGDGFEGFD